MEAYAVLTRSRALQQLVLPSLGVTLRPAHADLPANSAGELVRLIMEWLRTRRWLVGKWHTGARLLTLYSTDGRNLNAACEPRDRLSIDSAIDLADVVGSDTLLYVPSAEHTDDARVRTLARPGTDIPLDPDDHGTEWHDHLFIEVELNRITQWPRQ